MTPASWLVLVAIVAACVAILMIAEQIHRRGTCRRCHHPNQHHSPGSIGNPTAHVGRHCVWCHDCADENVQVYG